MEKHTDNQGNPGRTHSVTASPVALPDVATEPHPSPPVGPDLAGGDPPAGDGVLQGALPEIAEAARKVGGYKRLAEIAGQLDREGR